MKKSAFPLICGSILSTFVFLHLFCIGVDSPTAPQKTKVTVVFKSSTSKIFEGALADSVGKEIRIGAALYLPVNFDSVWIQVVDDESTVIDTVFRTFRSELFFDTVWVNHTFFKPGVKNVSLTHFPPLNARQSQQPLRYRVSNCNPKIQHLPHFRLLCHRIQMLSLRQIHLQ